jgi:hypothetical protein
MIRPSGAIGTMDESPRVPLLYAYPSQQIQSLGVFQRQLDDSGSSSAHMPPLRLRTVGGRFVKRLFGGIEKALSVHVHSLPAWPRNCTCESLAPGRPLYSRRHSGPVLVLAYTPAELTTSINLRSPHIPLGYVRHVMISLVRQACRPLKSWDSLPTSDYTKFLTSTM